MTIDGAGVLVLACTGVVTLAHAAGSPVFVAAPGKCKGDMVVVAAAHAAVVLNPNLDPVMVPVLCREGEQESEPPALPYTQAQT